MSRPLKPFIVARRGDAETFQITLSSACGLPAQVCAEWYRRSLDKLPDELAHLHNPKTKDAAETAAVILIGVLKKKLAEGDAKQISADGTTVGRWAQQFISIETSPRTARNAARNRLNSTSTIDTYKSYWNARIKDDPVTKLKEGY
jgi:hypothetical protein